MTQNAEYGACPYHNAGTWQSHDGRCGQCGAWALLGWAHVCRDCWAAHIDGSGEET